MSISDGPFFKDLPPAVCAQLRQTAIPRFYKADETLFREEDASTHLLVIASGRVRVWRTSARGAALTVHILRPGDLPGCAAVFRGVAYPATGTAIEDVHALSWPAERAFSLLAEHPVLTRNVLHFLGDRNEELLQRLHDLASQPVESRLARTILRLVGDGHGDRPVLVHGSRQDLAELVATTLHTVSRVISRWEEQGVVRGHRGRIEVLRPEALRSIGDPAA